MSYTNLHLGIAVDALEATLKGEAETLNMMRRVISHASWDSALIKNALQVADMQGMNGEDRYTYLSYHALVALETYFQRVLEISALYPQTPYIVSPPAKGVSDV
jgi:hypothetical protein